MMATRLERGFDGGQPESDERADGIADDLGALECFRQSFDAMFGLDNLIGCRFQANDALFHHFLDALGVARDGGERNPLVDQPVHDQHAGVTRSEEHTSELQSLMRISYAVFCLKKNTKQHTITKKE